MYIYIYMLVLGHHIIISIISIRPSDWCGYVKRSRHDCNILVANVVDFRQITMEMLSRLELGTTGLKTLTREVMGLLIDKPKHVTLSRWTKRSFGPHRSSTSSLLMSMGSTRLVFCCSRRSARTTDGRSPPSICIKLLLEHLQYKF
ncbi:uncharacterized protein LOC100277762 [Zea mays]|uniref:3'-5' exonuclease domain-containing protein n=1 Tax=Zea mays TaxID=4577 RepID=B6TZP3_MAIZE|nr:uncharacterized protein LOC100277762 [Zea mays]ACG42576.1 hypothetical protein [Zea mays]|eukprot:NP_001144720.1 uncharacterized protein LOC100277762 [Zea mays]